MATTGLKIVRLEAHNVKRLKAVEIVPAGNTVMITGKNDQGKTSVLDSIAYALGGKDEICQQPVRLGEAKAKIICDLGDIVVERRFTSAGGTSLEVRDREGLPQRSPQAILDALCSHIAFDPLSFVRMKSKEQLETLRKLVGLNFDEIDAGRQALYEERTTAGRMLENAKGRITAFPFHANAPKDEVSLAELTRQLVEVKQKNAEVLRAEQRIDEKDKYLKSVQSATRQMCNDIAELERQLGAKRLQLSENAAKEKAAVADYNDAVEASKNFTKLDESTIQNQINSIEQTNGLVRENRRHAEVGKEIEAQEAKVKQLSAEIQDCDDQKHLMIQAATFPLPGLSFDDNGVLLNGVPFTQGSQARQLQAAVAIGLALNPKVRVILIRDGSLLDDDSLKLISELAEKHDAQIWIELVNSKDPTAVVIEDGESSQF